MTFQRREPAAVTLPGDPGSHPKPRGYQAPPDTMGREGHFSSVVFSPSPYLQSNHETTTRQTHVTVHSTKPPASISANYQCCPGTVIFPRQKPGKTEQLSRTQEDRGHVTATGNAVSHTGPWAGNTGESRIQPAVCSRQGQPESARELCEPSLPPLSKSEFRLN